MRDAVCAVVAVINNSKGENSYMLATSLSNIFFGVINWYEHD